LKSTTSSAPDLCGKQLLLTDRGSADRGGQAGTELAARQAFYLAFTENLNLTLNCNVR
jgi:hypothetical protein